MVFGVYGAADTLTDPQYSWAGTRLQCGHRTSVDFETFNCSRSFDRFRVYN
jgi:hypothetical protein